MLGDPVDRQIAGIQTTLPFHRFVARHDGFWAGDVSIDWVAEHWDGRAERARAVRAAVNAAVNAAAHAVTTPDTGNPAAATRAVVAGPGPADGASDWATAGRAEGIDRWPR